MTWRKDYQIDSILEWEPPEDLKKACPYEITFNDRSGRPGTLKLIEKILIMVIILSCFQFFSFPGHDGLRGTLLTMVVEMNT